MLQLATRMNIGGPARHVLHLATQLPPRYRVEVAAGTPPSGEGQLNDPSVQVTPVELVRALRPGSDTRALRQVRGLLREGRHALLHTHMAKAGAVGRLAVASLRRGPVTVHTFHGHVLEGYFSPVKERAFVQAERLLARRTEALVAVSEQIRDALFDLGIGRSEQWHVVRPASDLTPFFEVQRRDGPLRAELGIPDGTTVVAVLGRLAPIKDHATLLRSLARTDVHLVVCGEGELGAELRARTAALELERQVHFVGWVADVPALLAQVDAVALTSRNEGTPLALVEAQAAGLPVLATDVGGVRDVVAPDVTGLLVPPGDEDAIRAGLRRLAADPALRTSLGEAGRQRMATRYAPQQAVEQVAALYDDLLAQRPPTR